jgi:hypothetical protein
MAIGDINPGYMGYANLSGISNKIRFSDANITVRQEVNAPDLIMGHWDHNAYVYGPIEIGGSMSGPVTENFAAAGDSLWTWATQRSDCGNLESKQLDLVYYCDRGDGSRRCREFPGMLVNSLTFSCAAGDVAQGNIDVLGTNAPTFTDAGSNYTEEEKLVTWDKVGVTISAGDQEIGTLDDACFSNFEFSINNNLETVYAICSDSNYFPYDIVPGLRTLTGSLSVYNIPNVVGSAGYDDWAADDQGTIEFNIAGESFEFKVRFHRVEPSSTVGPVISTVAFTGVGHQDSLDSKD